MSVLGTGFYEECTYIGKNSSTRTRFIQEATLREIGADNWTEEDAAYIFLTQKAKENNWDKSRESRKRPHEDVRVPYSGLERVLSGMNLKCKVIPVDIKDGKDESEMWDIFNAIYSCIEEEDELYFDLTHAFRYQPMLLLVLGNYAKFLKNVDVAYIGYGNYEGRKQIAEGHPELDEAPIMNLLPISVLQDWAFAAGQFIRSGSADSVCELGRGRYVQIKREIKEGNKGIDSVKSFLVAVSSLSEEMMLCRGVKIIEGEDIARMREYESSLNKEAIPELSPLIKQITDSFSEFCAQRNAMNSFYAAQWCLEKNLFQQAVTFLRESVVSLLCDKYALSITDSAIRKVVDDVFAAKNNRMSSSELSVSNDLKPIFCKLSSDPIFDNSDFVARFCYLKDIRNDLNHSGMRDNPANVRNLKRQISDAVKNIGNHLLHSDLILGRGKPAVFINYSNHPSSAWGEKQLAAAREYGEVVDLPFRIVGEGYDENKLSEIAEEETAKILALAAGKNATVHIMGEMTLTFAIVARLKASGVQCIASTTARQVTENADGTRTCTFNFVRFRAYE